MINILFQALVWHFYDVPKGILKGWGNFLYFCLNYFSVPTLVATFFSPWRKYGEAYSGVFDIKKNFESFIFNSMSRIIGAILRTGLIIIGIIFTILVFIIGLAILILWILTPLLLIIIFILGIKLLL
ncbi:hypothetical protein KKA24_02590 [Patescibacteria group bacterium]|nr:hypothetical protein [Patescibacteria group bacterium]